MTYPILFYSISSLLLIKQLVWVKKTLNNNVTITQGFYLLHSTEVRLLDITKSNQE